LEKQQDRTLDAMLADIPKACDVGSKENSQGYTESWIGYKPHIGTADGDLPIAALLGSASTHDSQVALPLMNVCNQRVTSLYDLADSGYCSATIREESRELGHVPPIDHNPRRGEKIEFLPHEAERYKARTGVERTNSDLKDNHGGRHVRARGATKVYAHLMYGILVIAAEQLSRLLN
jgi:IS5 family transposase